MKKLNLLFIFLFLGFKTLFSAQNLHFSKTNAATDNFITQWDLSKGGSSAPGGLISLSFGVTVAGAVNYSWRTTDNTKSGTGTIPAAATTVTITNLPANKIVELSIEPANFRRININGGTEKARLTDITQWGKVAWSSMENAFRGCSNLNISAQDIPNLTNVLSTSYMFSYCGLKNPSNIDNWDVSNVTDMSYMFSGSTTFNQNIGSWNVENVNNMSYMFTGASAFNQNIENWNVGNVTNMLGMFQLAKAFNQDISSWNVGNVTNMSNIFAGALSFNQDIGNWNVMNVTDMSSMFVAANVFNQNIGNWDVRKVTSMSAMFQGATSFNQNISGWNVGNVKNMSNMFLGANVFNQNIGIWDVSQVTNMSAMFQNATAFNQNLGSWKLNNAVEFPNMLLGSGMDCTYYSATLIGWSENANIPSGRKLGASGRTYGTNATAARNILVSTKGWTISGDSAGSSACEMQTLATQTSNKSQILVYKNDSDFIIKSDRLVNKVQIFDLSGRMLKEINGSYKETKINHQNLASSIYLLKIYTESEVINKKVIK